MSSQKHARRERSGVIEQRLALQSGGEVSFPVPIHAPERSRWAPQQAGQGSSLAVPVLTRRQDQVMQLLSSGLSRKDICAQLGISHGTVDQHIWRAFTKLGATNCAHAVSLYQLYQLGLAVYRL